MWVLYMMMLGLDKSTPVHVEKINVFRSRDNCIIGAKEYAELVTPDPRLKFKELPVWVDSMEIDDEGKFWYEEDIMRVRYGCVYIGGQRKILRDVSTIMEQLCTTK